MTDFRLRYTNWSTCFTNNPNKNSQERLKSNHGIKMKYLIFPGLILALSGIILIIYAVLLAIKVKALNRKKLTTDEELKEKIGKLIPLNLAGLFISFFGLIMLLFAIILG